MNMTCVPQHTRDSYNNCAICDPQRAKYNWSLHEGKLRKYQIHFHEFHTYFSVYVCFENSNSWGYFVFLYSEAQEGHTSFDVCRNSLVLACSIIWKMSPITNFRNMAKPYGIRFEPHCYMYSDIVSLTITQCKIQLPYSFRLHQENLLVVTT